MREFEDRKGKGALVKMTKHLHDVVIYIYDCSSCTLTDQHVGATASSPIQETSTGILKLVSGS